MVTLPTPAELAAIKQAEAKHATPGFARWPAGLTRVHVNKDGQRVGAIVCEVCHGDAPESATSQSSGRAPDDSGWRIVVHPMRIETRMESHRHYACPECQKSRAAEVADALSE